MTSTTLIITLPYMFNLHIHAGISVLIREHPNLPAIIGYIDEDDATKIECNMITGTRKKQQK